MTCKNGTTFCYHSDYSEIIIHPKDSEEEIKIDPEDLMEFARSAVSSEIIYLLENTYL